MAELLVFETESSVDYETESSVDYESSLLLKPYCEVVCFTTLLFRFYNGNNHTNTNSRTDATPQRPSSLREQKQPSEKNPTSTQCKHTSLLITIKTCWCEHHASHKTDTEQYYGYDRTIVL